MAVHYDVNGEVAVISHAFWRTQFGGDSSVVGRAFVLSGTTHTIVGVLPRGAEVNDNAQYWTVRSIDRIEYFRPSKTY